MAKHHKAVPNDVFDGNSSHGHTAPSKKHWRRPLRRPWCTPRSQQVQGGLSKMMSVIWIGDHHHFWMKRMRTFLCHQALRPLPASLSLLLSHQGCCTPFCMCSVVSDVQPSWMVPSIPAQQPGITMQPQDFRLTPNLEAMVNKSHGQLGCQGCHTLQHLPSIQAALCSPRSLLQLFSPFHLLVPVLSCLALLMERSTLVGLAVAIET
ncbi:hypothetical protein V5799_014262 [Amblyomma americanum]|uniref:Uncharacterized protein n=1 Tax=Amblyomma americanum TaxID=6943 RepID=A0AAQ4E3K3_AMBAM